MAPNQKRVYSFTVPIRHSLDVVKRICPLFSQPEGYINYIKTRRVCSYIEIEVLFEDPDNPKAARVIEYLTKKYEYDIYLEPPVYERNYEPGSYRGG
jgi:hypothetical protein